MHKFHHTMWRKPNSHQIQTPQQRNHVRCTNSTTRCRAPRMPEAMYEQSSTDTDENSIHGPATASAKANCTPDQQCTETKLETNRNKEQRHPSTAGAIAITQCRARCTHGQQCAETNGHDVVPCRRQRTNNRARTRCRNPSQAQRPCAHRLRQPVETSTSKCQPTMRLVHNTDDVRT